VLFIELKRYMSRGWETAKGIPSINNAPISGGLQNFKEALSIEIHLHYSHSNRKSIPRK
jgi:hypothetical protein